MAIVALPFAAGGREAVPMVLASLSIPFLAIVLLRLLALRHVGQSETHALPRGTFPGLADEDLPRYAVLVPLLNEADIVPDLVASLCALDYPSDRLEVLFLIEHDDRLTQQAFERTRLPGHMRVEIVPRGYPRTKPRALNHGLARTTADYLVVYDAEDVPEPDQLRRALALLENSPDVACVQARLNIYNSRESWLTRQFTLEYTALFDCLLPALERMKLPIPLGGTSNHFSRRSLVAVGGWDPYNVTEDADLGIRLARLGYRVALTSSTTWEEAPHRYGTWRGQRTRWLKGWMQTFLVHLREPARVARELGRARFIGFQVLIAGMLLSALVHPWIYVLGFADLMHQWSSPTSFAPAGPLAWLGLFNFVAGHCAGIALGALAIRARGSPGLALHALAMPAYWLLISFACYRALLELARAPFYWEKTEHRQRGTHSPGQSCS